ncbi:hypothetical protein J2X72_002506 [Phyllobacterium sp. 1468]|nr:hypothetical protein [Phyllobacterium sp. 1468]
MHGTGIMESPSTSTHKTEHTNICAGYQSMMTGIFKALRRLQVRERTDRTVCFFTHWNNKFSKVIASF